MSSKRNIAQELEPGGYNRERAFERIRGIGDKLKTVFAMAEERDISTEAAAFIMAQERLQSA